MESANAILVEYLWKKNPRTHSIAFRYSSALVLKLVLAHRKFSHKGKWHDEIHMFKLQKTVDKRQSLASGVLAEIDPSWIIGLVC